MLISASIFLSEKKPQPADSPFQTFVPGQPPQVDKPENREDEVPCRMLVEICCSLHRAVLREFLRSIREQLLRHEETQPDGQGGYRTHDRYELLAQLEQDLEDFVRPEQLREYWRRCGFLQRSGASTALFSRVHLPEYQAFAEVSLLTALNELYLRIVGKVFRESSTTDNSTTSLGKPEAAARPLFDPAAWRPVIAALLGGSVAGAGVGTADAGGAAIALAGLLGGIATGALSALLPNFKREQQVRRLEQVSKDYSLENLHREIPRIIDGMFQVGLCPVFIIDELDKSDRLERQIDELLRQFKQFFAQDGFFCFLTHREFFDSHNEVEGRKRFGVHTTWFNNRLIVEYLPWEMRRTVRRLIRTEITVEDQDQARKDCLVIEYVAVSRSQTRMSMLMETLSEFQTRYDSGVLTLGSVLSSDSPFVLEMVFQLVAEIVLQEMAEAQLIGHHTGELQLAQRVLALPGRWWKDSKVIEVEMPSDTDTLTGDRIQPVAQSFQKAFCEIESELQDSIGSDHQKTLIDDRLRTIFADAIWRSLILLNSEQALLLTLRVSDHHGRSESELIEDLHPVVTFSDVAERPSVTRIEFAYESNGRPVDRPSEQDEAIVQDAVEGARSRIEAVYRLVAGLQDSPGQPVNWSETTSGFRPLQQCGLIAARPAWTHVRRLLQSLGKDDLTAGEKQAAEVEVVAFAENLRQYQGVLFVGLAIACALGRLTKAGTPEDVLDEGLTILRKWYPRRSRRRDSYLRTLSRMLGFLPTPTGRGIPEPDALTMLLEREPWVSAVTLLRTWGKSCTSDPVKEQYLDRLPVVWLTTLNEYERRFRSTRLDQQSTDPKMRASLLIGEAAGLPSSTLFAPQFSRMTIRQWSRVVLHALRSRRKDRAQKDASAALPLWIGVRALVQLGFDHGIALQVLESQGSHEVNQDEEWSKLGEALGVTVYPDPLRSLESELSSAVSRRKRATSAGQSETIDLIIARGKDPLHGLSRFRPESGFPCLCLDMEETREFSSCLRAMDARLKYRYVAVEEPDSASGPEEYAEVLGNLVTNSSRFAAVHRKIPATSAFIAAFPLPERIEELLLRNWD